MWNVNFSVFGVNVRAGINVSQCFAKSVINNNVKGATVVNISSAVSVTTAKNSKLIAGGMS